METPNRSRPRAARRGRQLRCLPTALRRSTIHRRVAICRPNSTPRRSPSVRRRHVLPTSCGRCRPPKTTSLSSVSGRCPRFARRSRRPARTECTVEWRCRRCGRRWRWQRWRWPNVCRLCWSSRCPNGQPVPSARPSSVGRLKFAHLAEQLLSVACGRSGRRQRRRSAARRCASSAPSYAPSSLTFGRPSERRRRCRE